MTKPSARKTVNNMGFHRVIYLYCDGGFDECQCCGEEALSGDTGVFNTVEAYKSYMRIDGWLFKGPKAYCPGCRQALKGDSNGHLARTL